MCTHSTDSLLCFYTTEHSVYLSHPVPAVLLCPTAAAPLWFTTGGRACDSTQQHQHHWGQALHYLAAVAAVKPGVLQGLCLAVRVQG
jgi:hypothetical protein